MFKKILLPVDGSISAEKLITWTGALADRMDAEVVLLAVADPVEWIPWPAAAAWDDEGGEDGVAESIDPLPESTPRRGSMREYQAKAMAHALSTARTYLEQQAEKLRVIGVNPTVDVRQGNPANAIPEAVSENGADMVVMSSRRTSALARGILGSVTDRIIRTSPVPVLVAHPDYINKVAGHGHEIDSILVPLDGSEMSELAAGPAMGLAAGLGAKVVFMRVLEAGLIQGEPDPDDQDQAAEYLGQFVEAAQSDDLTANSRIVSGAAAAKILEEAGDEPGSLLAMGTHGRGGFRRFLLGSVTDKVVRSSPVPVMVVPPSSDRQ